MGHPEDHHQAIVEALLRTVAREGISAATLEAVAQEAGLEPGTARYYFADATDRLTHLHTVVTNHEAERLKELDLEHTLRSTDSTVSLARRRAAFENALAVLLPLDEERHQEARAWLAAAIDALTNPELQPRPPIDDFYQSLRNGLPELLTAAQHAGILRTDLDIDIEAEHLAALLHGLTLHAVLHPRLVTTDTILTVLRHHLASLETTR